ncbi:hypothetical protein CEXT_668441 [Caerostris extrusa]|uniref:Uncharacterized protein n=1 Tax=Caerostris extrusa TaxID=172846 RepID=A0AAV4UBF5_CAEEX|nr:hypothetical protein CEXT_668441 [Caerostris extrusa]
MLKTNPDQLMRDVWRKLICISWRIPKHNESAGKQKGKACYRNKKGRDKKREKEQRGRMRLAFGNKHKIKRWASSKDRGAKVNGFVEDDTRIRMLGSFLSMRKLDALYITLK